MKPRVIASVIVLFMFAASLPDVSISQTMPGKPYTMFGNPMCADWPEMNADAKFAWTSSFLSTLSMGHETSRRSGQQKFKDLMGIEEVIGVINKHCAANPQAQASEAAAPFLNP